MVFRWTKCFEGLNFGDRKGVKSGKLLSVNKRVGLRITPSLRSTYLLLRNPCKWSSRPGDGKEWLKQVEDEGS